MRSMALSMDFVIAVMMLSTAIAVILLLGNQTYMHPNREAYDIAVTFDSLGILWTDEATINYSLSKIDPTADVKINCYKFEGNWIPTYSVVIFNSNPDQMFWYRMIRYHDGNYCIIDIGVKE